MSLEILNNKGSGDLSDSKLLSENDVQSEIFRKESFFKKNTFDEISAFKDSPFGQYWEKRLPPWAVTDYGPSRVFHESNFSIIDLSKKFNAAPAKLYNSLTNENWDDIKFIVLANPDGQKVLKDYADPQKIPKDDEVYFFIESDDGKFDFGRIVRVKLGKNAILKIQLQFSFFNKTEKELADEFLKRPFEIKNGEQYDFFNQIKTETKYKPTNLTDLLVKAIKYDYNQKKFDDMSWFLLFLKGEEYVGLNLPKKLLEISQWMRTKKYEEEKYWNAFLVKDFTPAFLPNAITPQNRKNLKESIKNKLKQQIENLNKYDKETGAVEKVFKEILNNVLLYLFDKFSSLLDDGLKKLEDILPEEEMFNEIYNLNAFLVGLWNGCIEFTAGIVDLVALLMMIAKDGAGFILTDALKEAFENLLNELVYNFENFLKKLWEKFYFAIKEFPDWYLDYGSNQFFLYKKLGELTPDIVTLLIPMLKTGRAVESSNIVANIAKENSKEVSEEVIKRSAQELSKKLEQKTAQKEIKEIFDNTKNELEETIPSFENITFEGGTSKKVFAIWKVNFKEGRYNCANTAIATDATLAGRPASALPYTIQKRFRKGKLENYASFDKGTYPSVLEKEFNAKFTKWSEELNNLTKDLKPGKRGIIFGIKKGKNIGHYFNVINENGVIKYLDGQTGKRAKLVYDYYQFLPTN